MGCICSSASSQDSRTDKDRDSHKSTLHLICPPSTKDAPFTQPLTLTNAFAVRRPSTSAALAASFVLADQDKNPHIIVSRNPSRRAPVDGGGLAVQPGRVSGVSQLGRVSSVPCAREAELTSAGWPSWLASVAGDAIKGWLPRCAESFEKLDKIGQGTYSSVYKAKDLETGKIVAMKKVRFVNMDPESVRFMAREIHILRKLDHPNVMKLEGLVTSRLSSSLYLVFEYMEHDLAGLGATPCFRSSAICNNCSAGLNTATDEEYSTGTSRARIS